MSDVPTIVASLTYPNMLIDVPMARCYANAYMNHPEAVHALIEKLMGRSEFKGAYNDKYSVDAGRPDFKYGKFQIPEVKVQSLHNYSEIGRAGDKFSF